MSRFVQRKLIAVLVVATAALAPTGAASAAPADADRLPEPPAEAVAAAERAGTGPVLTEKCAKERRQAVAAARATAGDATGKATVATCSDYKPANGAGGARPNAVPSNCPSTWGYTRTTGCINTTAGVIVYIVQTGAIVGGFDYQVVSYANVSVTSRSWTHETEFTMLLAWGQVAGTFIRGDAWCTGPCSGNPSVPDQWFYALTARARMAVTANAITGGEPVNVQTNVGWWFCNVAWYNGCTNALIATPQPVRCDTSVPGASPGCVFGHVVPVFNVYSFEHPSFARHVALAIGYGIKSRLTRLTDPTSQQNNGNRACPASIPKPSSDWSCDEYPFRSTWEGAYTGGHQYGRTFEGCQIAPDIAQVRQPGDSGGYSICLIPASENSGGGTDLSVFYRTNRVLEREAFDVVVN
ncbi:NucA/NucB deoxyribonuclease domain-containing protein [Plantactinospora sonchi]|uniref:Deoxyribonuclease NucA/NucB domain-containing protein n=1 Tax=Plantactinospora sonchi TaxID=1544735 RepID=A0ABU7RPC7_9ACTN